MVYVIAPEETSLPLATVKSQRCCNGVNSSPCSWVNKKSINDAIAIVLNEILLLTILHSKTICSNWLATRVLADINDSVSNGLQGQLCSETRCFLKAMTKKPKIPLS